MPTKERNLDVCLEEFLTKVKKKTRNEETVKKYRWLIRKVNRTLADNGFEAHPVKWTEDTVEFLRAEYEETIETQVARWKFSILNHYLLFHGNTVIKDADIQWPPDARIHVDWLTPEDALRVMDSAGGMERIIMHLELQIGLRRIEVLRLKVKDIKLGYLNVLGKGRLGGKPRTNPFHPDTHAEVSYYLKLREIEIAKAESGTKIPDELLIYERGGKLYPYKRTAIDNRLKAVSERTGVQFTNHTLRRTFGRSCWLAGVALETIRDLLGHEDTKTTIMYLGINMDDKSGAMSQLAKYQAALKTAKNEASQMGLVDGPGLLPRPVIQIVPRLPPTRQP